MQKLCTHQYAKSLFKRPAFLLECFYDQTQKHRRRQMQKYVQQTAAGQCYEQASFTDQSKFEAMKTLSGRRALRCGKHQFCAKSTVNTWIVELWLLNKVV